MQQWSNTKQQKQSERQSCATESIHFKTQHGKLWPFKEGHQVKNIPHENLC